MRPLTDVELRLADAILVELKGVEVDIEAAQSSGLMILVPDRRDVSRVCEAVNASDGLLGADDVEARTIAVVVTGQWPPETDAFYDDRRDDLAREPVERVGGAPFDP